MINNSPSVRERVDDASTAPVDLDTLTMPDERDWEEERRPYLRYS